MTREEFIQQGWTGQMKAKVNGIVCDVINVDFEMFIVGLDIGGILNEVGCEHVAIINEETK